MKQGKSVEVDGLILAVEEIGEGPAIVFAHGLTGNKEGVFEQFCGIAGEYRLISYDQRGHGESTPVRDPALYDPYRMAEDMELVMKAERLEHAIVGGESMGAATALLFALKNPARVDALLLTAPAFGDQPNADMEEIWTMGDRIERDGLDVYLKQTREEHLEKDLPKELGETMERRLRTHDRHSIALACKTVIEWRVFETLSVVSDFPRPTCIVAWKDDDLHPYSLAEEMASLLPDATLIEHDLGEQFRNPGKTAQYYRSFLADVKKRPEM